MTSIINATLNYHKTGDRSKFGSQCKFNSLIFNEKFSGQNEISMFNVQWHSCEYIIRLLQILIHCIYRSIKFELSPTQGNKYLWSTKIIQCMFHLNTLCNFMYRFANLPLMHIKFTGFFSVKPHNRNEKVFCWFSLISRCHHFHISTPMRTKVAYNIRNICCSVSSRHYLMNANALFTLMAKKQIPSSTYIHYSFSYMEDS